MQRQPDHNCSNWPDPRYKHDNGWNTDYCPELPEHDIISCTKTQSLELYKTGNSDILIYDAETRERINTLSPVEIDAIIEIA